MIIQYEEMQDVTPEFQNLFPTTANAPLFSLDGLIARQLNVQDAFRHHRIRIDLLKNQWNSGESLQSQRKYMKNISCPIKFMV